MPDSQECCGSVVSACSPGREDHSRTARDVLGVSNSTDAAEVSAVPALRRATTSRSTPSSWVRSSSAEANRSAGSGAQHLAISQ